MQLRYGTYPFAVNSVEFSSSSELELSAARVPLAIKRSMEVTGYLYGDSQAEITLAQSALKTALAVRGRDLLFYQDSGALSADVMTNAGSIDGVVITKGPMFPESRGAEYATYRKFQFTAEATYPVPNAARLLVSFTETLAFSGGGPVYKHLRAINGPPVKMRVYPATEYVVVQTGKAVGYGRHPTRPGPMWPGALKEAGKYTLVAPERVGDNFKNYETTWEYIHESATPLVGVPTLWPLGS